MGTSAANPVGIVISMLSAEESAVAGIEEPPGSWSRPLPGMIGVDRKTRKDTTGKKDAAGFPRPILFQQADPGCRGLIRLSRSGRHLL